MYKRHSLEWRLSFYPVQFFYCNLEASPREKGGKENVRRRETKYQLTLSPLCEISFAELSKRKIE